MELLLDGEAFSVDGRPLAGMLLRLPPHAELSEGFVREDRSFSDAEIRAALLGASHLPSILAVNRYDPWGWFEAAAWIRWRRLLMDTGVPVSPLGFGDVPVDRSSRWVPFHATQVQAEPGPNARRALGAAVTTGEVSSMSLVVDRHVIDGAAVRVALEAADVLADHGILVASLAVDADGRVLVVDTQPPMNREAAGSAAALLSERFDAHLRGW